MKSVAVLLANGFEEGEALLVVDIIRRAGIQAHTISLKDKIVDGSHGIRIEADALFSDAVYSYDMVVLPGGLPGATNLRDDERVIKLLQDFNNKKKWIAAICAAPIVLAKAGVSDQKYITSYPAEDFKSVFDTSLYKEEPVVVDGNIVTSRGPATTFAFAYQLIECLGFSSEELKEGMLYNYMMKQS